MAPLAAPATTAHPEELPNPGDVVFAADRHYRRPSEASVPIQLTRDDEAGRFP